MDFDQALQQGPKCMAAMYVPIGEAESRSGPDLSPPARSYFAYLPAHRAEDPACSAFCDWIERVGRPQV